MIGAWLLVAAVAAEEPVPAIPLEDSAWRMSEPDSPRRNGRRLRIFSDRSACEKGGVRNDEIEACLPWVDPARRELHLAVGLVEEVGTAEVPVAFALEPEWLRTTAQAPVSPERVLVVPHDPKGFRQLFILLVDRSSSTYVDPDGADGPERPIMERVVATLLSDAVTSTFFPSDGSTGVLLLTFSSEVRDVYGNPGRDALILEDRESYEEAVKVLLARQVGETHLYDAVVSVVEEVLDDRDVRAFADRTLVDPAVVVMTDGFNWLSSRGGGQTCRLNVAPARDALLPALARSQQRFGRPIPIVSAVGLGKPAWHGAQLPPLLQAAELDEELLCPGGGSQVLSTLERQGVDNLSIELIARFGGGRAFVGDDARDLARFLAGTAVRPHRWYEVFVRLDEPAHVQRFRRPFEVRLEVARGVALETSATLFPDPWLDLPPAAVPASARWGARGRAGAATGLLVVALGATFGLIGLVIGGRHARRALLRAARRRPGDR